MVVCTRIWAMPWHARVIVNVTLLDTAGEIKPCSTDLSLLETYQTSLNVAYLTVVARIITRVAATCRHELTFAQRCATCSNSLQNKRIYTGAERHTRNAIHERARVSSFMLSFSATQFCRIKFKEQNIPLSSYDFLWTLSLSIIAVKQWACEDRLNEVACIEKFRSKVRALV